MRIPYNEVQNGIQIMHGQVGIAVFIAVEMEWRERKRPREKKS